MSNTNTQLSLLCSRSHWLYLARPHLLVLTRCTYRPSVIYLIVNKLLYHTHTCRTLLALALSLPLACSSQLKKLVRIVDALKSIYKTNTHLRFCPRFRSSPLKNMVRILDVLKKYLQGAILKSIYNS
jgi:hypothetical protein